MSTYRWTFRIENWKSDFQTVIDKLLWIIIHICAFNQSEFIITDYTFLTFETKRLRKVNRLKSDEVSAVHQFQNFNSFVEDL